MRCLHGEDCCSCSSAAVDQNIDDAAADQIDDDCIVIETPVPRVGDPWRGAMLLFHAGLNDSLAVPWKYSLAGVDRREYCDRTKLEMKRFD